MRATAGLVLLCAALAGIPDGGLAGLALDRQATLAGQAWRLWTGHWVHFSTAHAITDAAALAVFGGIVERQLGTAAVVRLCCVGAPLLSLALLLAVPAMALYAGSSGIAALFAGAAAASLWRRAPGLHGPIALVGAVLIGRALLDAAGVSPALTSLPDGVRVAWQAHLIGGMLGAAAAIGSEAPACRGARRSG